VVSVRKATSADASGILACLSAHSRCIATATLQLRLADTILTPETLHGRLQVMTVSVQRRRPERLLAPLLVVSSTWKKATFVEWRYFHSARQRCCRPVVGTRGGRISGNETASGSA